MKTLLRILFVSVIAALAARPAEAAETLTLVATEDFPILQVKGFAPTRVDKAKNVISVDGDITGYAFGMAQTKFTGADGLYDVTLTTIQDVDGVCEYFLRVGERDTAKFRQSGTEDGAPENHTWKGIALRKGDLIGVAGNGSDSVENAPGKGPKGFHMAHGRWSKLSFVRTGPVPTR